MSKYSFEFKKEVVQAYFNSEVGRPYIANKYGIVIIISSFQESFKLKDRLSYIGMPKATYMYWQKKVS